MICFRKSVFIQIRIPAIMQFGNDLFLQIRISILP